MNQNSTIQHIELASKLESLTEIEVFIDDVYEHYNFNEDCYGNILIALTEAVNNAITHGNKLDPTKTVKLEMRTTSDGLEFTIKDEGYGFDYKNVPDPTLPENLEKVNGRGVFLMQSLADDVQFEKNGAIITLMFSMLSN